MPSSNIKTPLSGKNICISFSIKSSIMGSSDNLRLAGKVAIITGGASGIGEATVRLFAAHGASVVIADINDTAGLAIASSILPPGRCSFVHCDVRKEPHLAAAVSHAVDAYGRLDILFSNAGVIGCLSGLLDLDPADWDEILAVNVCGTAMAIKHAGRAMVAAGTLGSIICTSSIGGVVGWPLLPAYQASKQAVVGVMRVAAAELGGRGVRVNCISPSLVPSPMSEKLLRVGKKEREEIMSSIMPLKGALLEANDVAAAALFLASDDSAFISGHNLTVDGAITTTNTALSI